MKLNDIRIRDPFVLPEAARGFYYLFGTTNSAAWGGTGTSFECYRSRDLAEWEGPLAAFIPPEGFWATKQFWAPEVHAYRGRYYMLATFKAEGVCRGTQVLVADAPEGPYTPWSEGRVTPSDWECLDGTLYVDDAGVPWMVFCQEWLQAGDGGMAAIRLAEDLRRAVGEPEMLFRASSAPWSQKLTNPNPGFWEPNAPRPTGDMYVTDGPFLQRAEDGSLLMLWSSSGERGYAMGIAHAASGQLTGPWMQEASALFPHDGGHGMIFRAFDGKLYLTLHQPNYAPAERAVLRRIELRGTEVRLMEEG